jgi:NADPH-dependent curcumin reductase CurA
MVADGSLRAKTTEFTGLDQAPRAFVELLAGGTVGTTIVTL